MDSGFILVIGPTEVIDDLDVSCKGKKGTHDDS